MGTNNDRLVLVSGRFSLVLVSDDKTFPLKLSAIVNKSRNIKWA